MEGGNNTETMQENLSLDVSQIHDKNLKKMISLFVVEERETDKRGRFHLLLNGKTIRRMNDKEALREEAQVLCNQIQKERDEGVLVGLVQGGEGDRGNFYGIKQELRTLLDLTINGTYDYSISSKCLQGFFSKPNMVRTEYRLGEEAYKEIVAILEEQFHKDLRYILTKNFSSLLFLNSLYSPDIISAYITLIVDNCIKNGSTDFGAVKVGVSERDGKRVISIEDDPHKVLALQEIIYFLTSGETLDGFETLESLSLMNIDHLRDRFIDFLVSLNIEEVDTEAGQYSAEELKAVSGEEFPQVSRHPYVTHVLKLRRV